jgi:hypothetical protein
VWNTVNGQGELTIKDSVLHDCGTAIAGGVYASLDIETVEFADLTFGGIEMGWGAGGVGGEVRIVGGNFHDMGALAIRIGSTSNLNQFTIRDTSVSCAAGAAWNCIYLDGGNASTVDLGTVNDPGGNTFLHGNVNQTALWLGFQAVAVTAVGNAWIASQQGADAQGQYSAPQGSGNKVLVNAPVTSGRNYQLPYGGSILLAENP